LVVAPECALQHTIDLLKKVIDEMSDFSIFIISLITRYISGPCCSAQELVSNFSDPDYLNWILSGLTKLKLLLRKKLAPATVLDGIELICGPGCGRKRVEQVLRAGWVADPVYPNHPNLLQNGSQPDRENCSLQPKKRSESSVDAPSSRGPGQHSRESPDLGSHRSHSRMGSEASLPRASSGSHSYQNYPQWPENRGRAYISGNCGMVDVWGRPVPTR
jgi:hypothetical protein